jgi:hypothetical protein
MGFFPVLLDLAHAQKFPDSTWREAQFIQGLAFLWQPYLADSRHKRSLTKTERPID